MDSLSESFSASPSSNVLDTSFNEHNTTFNKESTGGANSTFTTIPSTPANRTIKRDRQKTMVVESPIVAEIKGAFAVAKQELTAERIAELERTVLSGVQRMENDCNRRVKECERKHDSELLVGRQIAEEFVILAEQMAEECEAGRVAGGGGCDENCTAAEKLKMDLEAVNAQLDDRCNEYMKLHEVFLQLRKATTMQKEEYTNLEGILKKERDMYSHLKGKFLRLRDSATAQLEKASMDVNRLEQENKEKTIGLRMKVKQLETSLETKEKEIELKKSELSQLRDIVNTLMQEVQPVSDGESERE